MCLSIALRAFPAALQPLSCTLCGNTIGIWSTPITTAGRKEKSTSPTQASSSNFKSMSSYWKPENNRRSCKLRKTRHSTARSSITWMARERENHQAGCCSSSNSRQRRYSRLKNSVISSNLRMGFPTSRHPRTSSSSCLGGSGTRTPQSAQSSRMQVAWRNSPTTKLLTD